MFFYLHLTHHLYSKPVLFHVSAQFLFPVPVIWYLSPARANTSFSFSGIVVYCSHHTQLNWTLVWTTNHAHRNMILHVFQRPLTHCCLLGWGSMVMPSSAGLSCLSILKLWDTRVHTQRNVFWMLSCPTNRLLWKRLAKRQPQCFLSQAVNSLAVSFALAY